MAEFITKQERKIYNELMIQELYKNPRAIFKCIRSREDKDIDKIVCIALKPKQVCWEGNPTDTYCICPEDVNRITFIKIL